MIEPSEVKEQKRRERLKSIRLEPSVVVFWLV